MSSLLKSALLKLLVPGSILLSAFSSQSRAGGIVFEIYLNNQLLLKQAYNKIISGSPDLQLTAANYNDQLKIYFSSCHATSKTRSVGIKDENNEVIKKWDFENNTSSDISMTIPVKEILDLQKGKQASSLRLFFFSPDQFRDGYMLASLQPVKKNTAFQLKNTGGYPGSYTSVIFAPVIAGRTRFRKA